MERFVTYNGWNDKPIYVASLSGEELVAKICAEWDWYLICELCCRAGLHDEWEVLHDEDMAKVEALVKKAANILGVKIPDEEPSRVADNELER